MQLIEARATDVQNVINDYCDTTHGMAHAVLLTSGGLILSSDLMTATADAERTAALASSLMSLTKAAAQAYHGGAATAVVINTERHNLCLSPVDDKTRLMVTADRGADLGHIMYVTALMARELASLLDDATRTHLCRMFLNPG